MFCTQCGTSNADNAIVCVRCGRNLQAPPSPIQGAQPMPPPYVSNYLVFAILTTVLCCLPAGIPAIVYAAQVNSKLQAGDIAGATLASKNAKMWCWIAAGAGLVVCLLSALLMMLGALSNMHH